LDNDYGSDNDNYDQIDGGSGGDPSSVDDKIASVGMSDWYVEDAITSLSTTTYFDQPDVSPTAPPHSALPVDYTSVPLHPQPLLPLAKIYSLSAVEHASLPGRRPLVNPTLFLSDGNNRLNAIATIAKHFSLNQQQRLAPHIVATHSLGNSRVGEQLLMGIFGEGGTGKSVN
jgi:hypothetical protein